MVRGPRGTLPRMAKRHSVAYYRLIGIVGTTPIVTRLHPVLYRLTGGRWVLGRSFGMRTVILIVTGRRTGRSREVPLFAFEDGDRLVVIGSNGGDAAEPAWVANLRGRPEATVRIGRELRPVVAREAEGDERLELWRRAVEVYRGFAVYQRRTARRIPVIVLEPATGD
jgi:deazaflavin-dependent oxidoreductase (nitroreductase family)